MAEVARDSENDPLDSASNLIADPPPQTGYENASTREHNFEPCPQEWWKTLVMLLYMLTCMFCMTVTMVIVHDHVPDQNTTMYLKDVAWNITSDWPTGVRFCFRATEVVALLLCALTGWHLVSSKFRSVLLRRFFFHLGHNLSLPHLLHFPHDSPRPEAADESLHAENRWKCWRNFEQGAEFTPRGGNGHYRDKYVRRLHLQWPYQYVDKHNSIHSRIYTTEIHCIQNTVPDGGSRWRGLHRFQPRALHYRHPLRLLRVYKPLLDISRPRQRPSH